MAKEPHIPHSFGQNIFIDIILNFTISPPSFNGYNPFLDRAMEYGVRAQESLNQMRRGHSDELSKLQERYQETLDTMVRDLDPQGSGNDTRGNNDKKP